ncbi:hypothetical protein ACKKBF_B02915 [Auxenochlorella protothecoides x Auxenochlorella symbiontica]
MTGVEPPSTAVTSVESLRPDAQGLRLLVKVVDVKTVLDKAPRPNGRTQKVAECLIGDETGTILFTARNEQVEIAKPDTYLDLRGAKIDMVNNSMRLAVAPGGSMEAVTGHTFNPRTDFNLSLVEFELVLVPREEAGPSPAPVGGTDPARGPSLTGGAEGTEEPSQAIPEEEG